MVVQHCRGCGRLGHPPVPVCPGCRSADLDWVEVSGRGTIHQYTVMHQPLVRGFEDALPYACVAVELSEQPGLLLIGNLVQAEPAEAMVGLEVEAVFEDLPGGGRLPQFRPLRKPR